MNEYVVCDDITYLFFFDGSFTIFDTEDLPRVKAFNWAKGNGYVKAHICYPFTQISLSRLILSFPYKLCVDHKNRNTLDNTKENLRISTVTENNRNRPLPSGSSNYRGVTKRFRHGKTYFEVSIRDGFKKQYIGKFLSAIDAAIAYDTHAKKLHGEFALLNFPERNS